MFPSKTTEPFQELGFKSQLPKKKPEIRHFLALIYLFLTSLLRFQHGTSWLVVRQKPLIRSWEQINRFFSRFLNFVCSRKQIQDLSQAQTIWLQSITTLTLYISLFILNRLHQSFRLISQFPQFFIMSYFHWFLIVFYKFCTFIRRITLELQIMP